MDKLRGISQFILLLVVLFLPLQAQATIPAGPKDAGKPQDAGKPTHAPEPTYQVPPIDPNDLLDAGLVDCSEYTNRLDNWVYSGPGWTAGMDPRCTSLYDDCKPYWLEAGKPDPGSNEPVIDVRYIHAKDKERAEKDGMGQCFPDPVWGTPDECAYMHDMACFRAYQIKNKHERGKAIAVADLQLNYCVRQFTEKGGARYDENLAGNFTYEWWMSWIFIPKAAGDLVWYDFRHAVDLSWDAIVFSSNFIDTSISAFKKGTASATRVMRSWLQKDQTNEESSGIYGCRA